ncbi:alpha/beta fold hydrolase [Anaerolineales bacterium HSG6]|nr:alpha/beta fold hydrolase [Anaerolineales bacterium HSG6]
MTTHNRPTSKRIIGYWLRLSLFAIIVSLIGLFPIVLRQVDIILTPKGSPDIGTPNVLNQPYQDVTFMSKDGLTISAWYIEGERDEALILVHGINANRRGMLSEAKILSEAGYPLLMLDLRGNGLSEGDELTYGYKEAWDVSAGVDYLLDLPEVEQVGAVGHSLGGAVAVRAAAIDERIKAVVVESSYSSLPNAVNDAFNEIVMLPQWPFQPFVVALAEYRVGLNLSDVNSIRDIATISPRPVYIIHGTKDHLFLSYHADMMYEAAQAPKTLWLIEGMGHQSPAHAMPDAYHERVVTFFERAFEACESGVRCGS